MHHPTDRIIHTTSFVTPVMEHWLEQEIWLTEIFLCEILEELLNSTIMTRKEINNALNTFYLQLYGKGPFR